MPDRLYGLIGKTLKHSFSKNYFTEKFKKEQITDADYELFELTSIEQVIDVFKLPNLRGVNITIPYKLEIIPFLDSLDESAKKVGAVNVVKINRDRSKTGYNSDYFGFRRSLENWADMKELKGVLVLGTGGASRAIIEALKDLKINVLTVSRTKEKGNLTYEDVNFNKKILDENLLIINCTPLGTYPDIGSKPDLNYNWLSPKHYLYDLVYNPEKTAFMKEGSLRGSKVKNGLEMLILQAEKSWEIWNS